MIGQLPTWGLTTRWSVRVIKWTEAKTLPFVGLAALKTPILSRPISAGISPSDPLFSLQAFELFAADRLKVFNWESHHSETRRWDSSNQWHLCLGHHPIGNRPWTWAYGTSVMPWLANAGVETVSSWRGKLNFTGRPKARGPYIHDHTMIDGSSCVVCCLTKVFRDHTYVLHTCTL